MVAFRAGDAPRQVRDAQVGDALAELVRVAVRVHRAVDRFQTTGINSISPCLLIDGAAVSGSVQISVKQSTGARTGGVSAFVARTIARSRRSCR